MIAAFDTSFLSLALNPHQSPSLDPATGKPVARVQERVNALIDGFGVKGDVLIVPTPVLAEVLCVVPDLQKALDRLNQSSAISLSAFDVQAAVELAYIEKQAITDGTYKSGNTPKQKAKFDRQTAIIAKVNGAKNLYTDDENMASFARRIDMNIVHTWQLPMPPPNQTNIGF